MIMGACANLDAELQEMLLSESSRSPLVYIVAEVLDAVTTAGDSRPDAPPTPYDAAFRPETRLRDYLRRFSYCTRCSSSVVVVAVLLIDRFACTTGYFVHSLNVHNIVAAALVLASKWSTDKVFANADYAKVLGLPASELNFLERQFVTDLDWELSVSETDLATYVEVFRKHRQWPAAVAGQQRRRPRLTVRYVRDPSPTAEVHMELVTPNKPAISPATGNSSEHDREGFELHSVPKMPLPPAEKPGDRPHFTRPSHFQQGE
eukprot:TRINITY_DN9798_c0_g1_i3.p1 TRINITY_DN9798_c0_g1~~TRINITY_DN9798_c0_g1_i3.p1  ORF type:complete len:262 (+),score=76.29 TRINITY_DN9798_c0_g1_i3:95-880(+)